MTTTLEGKHFARSMKTVFHPIRAEDRNAMTAMRAIVEPNKGRLRGTAARVPFDAIMEHVAVPEGVTFEAATVGGIAGWWCRPHAAPPNTVVLHIHGGWFNWGSAKAYRNLVGHLALHAHVAAFVPDYRLAPEHSFPAAADDVRATYLGLLELGYKKIAVTGDSAGGNLALELLVSLEASQSNNLVVPIAGVLLSPVTDLSLSGASWTTRTAADPYFTQSQAAELVRSYLNGAEPRDPSASPLYADLTGLPPILVHVGDDEVLLDDSVRLVDRAQAAGVDAQLDVWEGMAHGFHGSVGLLNASAQALLQIGSFLSERFAESDIKTVIEQAYSAFNKRDIDAALALMSEDVSWPKASEGGRVVGKEEIRAYWTRQWAEFDPRVEPLAVTEEDGGKVCVTVHQLVKSLQGDVLSDSEILHVFTVKSGLIAAMNLGNEADPTAGPSAAFRHPVDAVSLRTPAAVEIRSLAPDDDATAFGRLNEEWITRYFALEEKDRETLNDPVGSILLKGGHIFMAYAGAEAVGCVALIPMGDGVYELSKMAVSPHLRGRGLGRRLLQHAVAQARSLGAKSLFLGSNRSLKDAIHLYESVGFRHVKPETLPPMPYSRADVFMEMPLG